jgi:hypothetical protein
MADVILGKPVADADGAEIGDPLAEPYAGARSALVVIFIFSVGVKQVETGGKWVAEEIGFRKAKPILAQ